jgi:HNH endonuclease
MATLAALLPRQYSPLQPSGRGLQSVYLTAIPAALMTALSHFIGDELTQLLQMTRVAEPIAVYEKPQIDWEEHLQAEIASNSKLDETQKEQLILARRGQGEFRKNVQAIERFCRVTKVDHPEHLRASHCKPWRDCQSSDERLNGENGLLLTPNVDHLFDRGFISFQDNGNLLVSPVAHDESLRRMGIRTNERLNVGSFSEGQERFLDFHRNFVFLEAAVSKKIEGIGYQR